MRESDSRSQIQAPDAILIRRTTPGETGITNISSEPVMRLPQWRSVFTTPEPMGILPEGLTKVDTTQVDPKGENPHIVVAGESVGGEHVVPLVDGVGAVQLEPGVEVVINAQTLSGKIGGNGRDALSRRPLGDARGKRSGW